MRRKTNNYTIIDIDLKANKKFGTDISFEFQDKYGFYYEAGNFGVRMNKIEQLYQMKIGNYIDYPIPKFFWSTVIGSNSLDMTSIEQDMMTLEIEKMEQIGVDSLEHPIYKWESRLGVDKIKLGSFDLKVEKIQIDGVNVEKLMWGNVVIAQQNSP